MPVFHPQPENVLLRSCGSEPRGIQAKISDFGLSFKLDPSKPHKSRALGGTKRYISPEALLDGNKGKAADV